MRSMFCNKQRVRDDLFLKPNVPRLRRMFETKYEDIPVEDLVELASARCEHLGVSAIVPTDKFAAIAVLEGLRGNPGPLNAY